MKIVMSYTPQETRELALQLREALLTVDEVSVWLDESDEENLERVQRTQEAILNSDLVMVLMTPDINRTVLPPSFLMMDVMFAKQHQKPILPLLVVATRIPPQLAGLPVHDFTQNRPAAIRKVVAEIRERTGGGNTATIRLEKSREELKNYLDNQS